jgi:hypothetical protein
MKPRSSPPEQSPMSTFGRTYPPFLQEAVDHAERFVLLLESIDTRTGRTSAGTWLLGRVEEVECLVGALIEDFRRDRASEAEAAKAVSGYLKALHKGLAIQFGELAPCCCADSMTRTAPSQAKLAVTAVLPVETHPGWEPASSTWAEVEEGELVMTGC